MQTRREFLGGLATAASCAALRTALGDTQFFAPSTATQRRVTVPESAYFRALEMVGRVTGSSAFVNLVTAEDLSATVQAQVRWAQTPEDLPGSPNVSPVVSTSDPSARMADSA